MKAAPFEYRRPATLDQAIVALSEAGNGASVLAGGQSLLPLMHLRLVRPRLLVDLNGLPDLDGIRPAEDGLHIGALTRHRTLETAVLPPPFNILSAAAARVGSVPIRTRGTFGGSLAHADPAAELPLIAVTLSASVVLRGPENERAIPAEQFLMGAFETAAADDEIVTGIVLPPAPSRARWSFDETTLPLKVVAAVVVEVESDGRCSWARVGLGGIAAAPRRCQQAEAAMVGSPLDSATADAAAGAAMAELGATQTVQAHVVHLGGVLVRRAVERLGESAPEDGL